MSGHLSPLADPAFVAWSLRQHADYQRKHGSLILLPEQFDAMADTIEKMLSPDTPAIPTTTTTCPPAITPPPDRQIGPRARSIMRPIISALCTAATFEAGVLAGRGATTYFAGMAAAAVMTLVVFWLWSR